MGEGTEGLRMDPAQSEGTHSQRVQGRERECWVLRCPAAVLRDAARLEDGCDTQGGGFEHEIC